MSDLAPTFAMSDYCIVELRRESIN